jgi:hypothetical protein
MKPSEIKDLMIASLDQDADQRNISDILGETCAEYDFSSGFTAKIVDRIFMNASTALAENEFFRSMRFVFNRVALTGVAAIVILLISIFLAEGSLSINSFLGIGDTYDESIVCLLTGN